MFGDEEFELYGLGPTAPPARGGKGRGKRLLQAAYSAVLPKRLKRRRKERDAHVTAAVEFRELLKENKLFDVQLQLQDGFEKVTPWMDLGTDFSLPATEVYVRRPSRG